MSVTVAGEASFHCAYCTLFQLKVSINHPPTQKKESKKTTCPVRNFESLCVQQRRPKSLFSVRFYKYTSRMWPAPAKIPTGQ